MKKTLEENETMKNTENLTWKYWNDSISTMKVSEKPAIKESKYESKAWLNVAIEIQWLKMKKANVSKISRAKWETFVTMAMKLKWNAM